VKANGISKLGFLLVIDGLCGIVFADDDADKALQFSPSLFFTFLAAILKLIDFTLKIKIIIISLSEMKMK